MIVEALGFMLEQRVHTDVINTNGERHEYHPLQYINQKKIEKAQLILITEDIPVKNIAYLLAYEDHSYFNRLFKKITDVTPQQYRELYKK